MVSITEAAARRIRSLKEEDGKGAESFLRVDVKKGGCSGLSYKMEFDTQLQPEDQTFEAFGEKIAVGPDSLLYILGMTLDYSGGLNGKGFVFDNPNAKKKCGCGTSFNV